MTLEQKKLIVDHMVFVRMTAANLRKILPVHVNYDDLVSSGYYALTMCALNFDPTRDCSFMSYAKYRVRGEMVDYLRSRDFMSRELRRCKKRLDALAEKMRLEKLGELQDLSLSELSAKVNYPCLTVTYALNIIYNNQKGLSNFERIVAGETREFSSQDRLPDVTSINTEAKVIVDGLLSSAPERHRQAAILYYYEDRTMKEIGEIMNINESRVSQILKDLRAKFLIILNESGLTSVDQITA